MTYVYKEYGFKTNCTGAMTTAKYEVLWGGRGYTGGQFFKMGGGNEHIFG